MPCIDQLRRRLALCGVALVTGCSTRDDGALQAGSAAHRPGTAPAAPGRGVDRAPVTDADRPPAPGSETVGLRSVGGDVRLPPPRAVRSWSEVRLQAAQRMVAAHPTGTYLGAVPEQLLAIPVLEIELNGDGSVRRIGVLRPPRQAKDTIQIAMAAVRRAAPFGDVSRLPKPWRFVETFLFDDDRRFKPRTLDT